jgi:hypothetical protein
MPRKNQKKKKLKVKIPKLPFKKLGIIGLIIIVTVTIFLFRDLIFCPYPAIVMQYKMRYNQMATSEYLEQLRGFANGSLIITGYTQEGDYLELSLNDSIAGLNYSQLLDWEHRHLMYYGYELQTRPELPIEILTTNLLITEDGFIALGRCGEFALLYNGLLLANGYRSRIIVDCSMLMNASKKGGAGDHVWSEIYINDIWIHCDPTEQKINQPDMYANPDRWNKDVNLVYAIEGNIITDVTETYR